MKSLNLKIVWIIENIISSGADLKIWLKHGLFEAYKQNEKKDRNGVLY